MSTNGCDGVHHGSHELQDHTHDKHYGRSFSETKYLRESERDRRLRLANQRSIAPQCGYSDGGKSRITLPISVLQSGMQEYRQRQWCHQSHVQRIVRKVQEPTSNVMKSFYMNMPPELKAYTHCMISRLAMYYGNMHKFALYVNFNRWRGWAGCMLLQQELQFDCLSQRNVSRGCFQWQYMVLQSCHAWMQQVRPRNYASIS